MRQVGFGGCIQAWKQGWKFIGFIIYDYYMAYYLSFQKPMFFNTIMQTFCLIFTLISLLGHE
jgi:hypothetical protein